ncbi:MAG: hypothetical protein OEW11_03640 [Nitrospirota bacterium]|nr:hypothetical protein [Nitrospirota bacterium]
MGQPDTRADRRRRNLEALLGEITHDRFAGKRGAVKFLAERIASNANHLSVLLGGGRPVSDDMAERIEHATGKPLGWMDQDHSSPQHPAPAQANPASTQGTPAAADVEPDESHAPEIPGLISPSQQAALGGRIAQIMAGRPPRQWAVSMGLSERQIGALLHGRAPSADALSALARVENISLSWLLYGQGAPFVVEAPDTDLACAALLRRHLTDDSRWWSVNLINSGESWCVALTQPGHLLQSAGGWVDFTVVAVLAGSLGPLTLAEVRRAIPGGAVFSLETTPDILTRLRTGHLGNSELLPLLDAARPLAGADSLPYPRTGSGMARAAQPQPPGNYGGDLLTAEEVHLLRRLRELPPERRRALAALVDSFTGTSLPSD